MPYTLAELRTRTREILNEATAAFFTDAEIDRWLGDAAWDISGVMRCVEALGTITLSNGDNDYAIAADAIVVLHVQDQATGVGLRKVTPSMAGHTSSETTGETGLGWYEFARTLYIEPIPDATAQGKQVEYFYARITQDVMVLPEYCQLLAVWYAASMGKAKDRLYHEAAVFQSLYVNGLAFRRADVFAREPHTRQDLEMADEAVSGG